MKKTDALFNLTTLVEPLYFTLEIIVALLHSLELITIAIQKL